MKQYQKKALKLPWSVAAEIASAEIEKIIGRKIHCTGSMDDVDYWCFMFKKNRMLMSEVHKILETIGATEKQRIECLPTESDRMTSVNCLGMSVCSILLQRQLGYKWECEHIEEDGIWLLGEIISENAAKFK